MRWLLSLYPSAWRARYGEEMAALLADYPVTVCTVLDLVLGALDAHLNESAWTHRAWKGAHQMLRRGAVGGSLVVLLTLWTLFVLSHPIIPGPPEVPALGGLLVAEMTGLAGLLVVAGVWLLVRSRRWNIGGYIMIVFSVIGVGFKSLWEITGIGRVSAVEPVFPHADARLLVGLVVVAAVLTIITAMRLPKLMARELARQ